MNGQNEDAGKINRSKTQCLTGVVKHEQIRQNGTSNFCGSIYRLVVSQKKSLPEEWLKKTSELAIREGFMGKFKAVFILRLCLTFLGAVNRRERGVMVGA